MKSKLQFQKQKESEETREEPAEEAPELPSCKPGSCQSCPSRNNCGNRQDSQIAEPTEQNLKIAETLTHFKKIYLVLSGKGGVGKSTVATQLAFYLADCCNQQVALLDLDICGPSIPTMTGTVEAQVESIDGYIQPAQVSPNLQALSIGFMLNKIDDPVIMRGPKKHALILQFLSTIQWQASKGILIVDTPPGTTDEHLSVVGLIQQCSQLVAEKNRPQLEAVIVSTPQEVALSDVRKELNFCKQMKLKVNGVVENMSGFVCPGCKKETQIFIPSNGGVAKMCEEFGVKFLGRIPLDVVLVKAGEQGQPWSGLVEESVGLDMFVDVVAKLLE